MALNFVCLNNDSKHWNKVSENFGKVNYLHSSWWYTNANLHVNLF